MKKFDQRKYKEKYNIIDSWVVLKRLTDEEIKNLEKKNNTTITTTTENESILPNDITDLIKSSACSQSFSNVDDISFTPRAVQLITNDSANLEALSNDENSSSYKTCTGSISNGSGFSLDFVSEPELLNLMNNSDDDGDKTINFAGDEYLLKPPVSGMKTTMFSNFAVRL